MKRNLNRLMGIMLTLVLMLAMSLTAYADSTIYNPASTYDGFAALASGDDTVSIEGVQYNNTTVDWYVIRYDSTAKTVTLLSKQPFGNSKFNNSQNDGHNYDGSVVKRYVEGLTEAGQPLAGIKDVLAYVDVADPTVTGKVPYLLNISEASNNLTETKMTETKRKGVGSGFWWLRSPGNAGFYAAYVSGWNGNVYDNGNFVDKEFGVRPALKLNLSSVIFSSESNTFSLKPSHTHSFTYAAGTGDNANKITASCGEGCDITEGLTLTISAPTGDLTADGTTTFPATLSTGYNTTAFPGTYSITYKKDGQSFDGTPKDAGAYTASVTVGDATASVSYTISESAALTAAKTNATATVNAVNAADYIAADQQTVTSAINTALAAINAATTEDEVTAALNTFSTAISGCTTQAAQDLADAKTTATETVNGVNAADYIAADQQTVTNAKTTALAAINAATTEDEVTAAMTTFNNAIAACTTQAAADQTAANAVSDTINALPAFADVTTANKDAIEAARTAYNALTNDQKALVSADTLKKLTDAEDKLVIIQVMSEVSAKTGSDVTYTGNSIQLINAPTTALPEGYTMKYAVTTENVAPTDDNLYTTSIPTGTDAGT